MSKPEEPITGNDLTKLAYRLEASAGDLQRVLGLSPYDWAIYTHRVTKDGEYPELTEPAISILARIYLAHPEAFPIPVTPTAAEVLEMINRDRISKGRLRKLEKEKGIHPNPKIPFTERARQFGEKPEVPMNLLAKTLGKHETAGVRWLKDSTPSPAIRNILLFIKNRIEADGDSRVFDEIFEMAQTEASARGMGSLEEVKSWKAKTRAELLESLADPE